MPSVFAAPQTHAGGFRADRVRLTIAGRNAPGLVIQNIQFSFSQQVTLLYEIGSNNVYYVGGRAQGNATIGRILGPAAAQCALLTSYGDLCQPKDIAFSASSGCEANTGCSYTLKKAVMTTITASVNSNDIVINESLQLMFTDIDLRQRSAVDG